MQALALGWLEGSVLACASVIHGGELLHYLVPRTPGGLCLALFPRQGLLPHSISLIKTFPNLLWLKTPRFRTAALSHTSALRPPRPEEG